MSLTLEQSRQKNISVNKIKNSDINFKGIYITGNES